MLPENIREFVTDNHHGVITAFRRNGAVQLSIITCGAFRDGVAFTTTAERAKLGNLKRDPRCSLMVSKEDWWGFVVLEGRAEILGPDNTEAEELRLAFRDVYRATTGEEHPDWDDYDQAMVRDRRSIVIVVPDHVYGTAA